MPAVAAGRKVCEQIGQRISAAPRAQLWCFSGTSTVAIAERINRDVVEIVRTAAVIEKIRSSLQMDPIGNSRAEAGRLFADDTGLWAKVIKDANVTID